MGELWLGCEAPGGLGGALSGVDPYVPGLSELSTPQGTIEVRLSWSGLGLARRGGRGGGAQLVALKHWRQCLQRGSPWFLAPCFSAQSLKILYFIMLFSSILIIFNFTLFK